MGEQLLTWTPSFNVVVKKNFSLFYKVINLMAVLLEATAVAQLSDADIVLVPISKVQIRAVSNL